MTKSKFSAFSPYYFHVFSAFFQLRIFSAFVMRRSAKNCGENAELRKGCGDLRYGHDSMHSHRQAMRHLSWDLLGKEKNRPPGIKGALCCNVFLLMNCGLVMPYDITELDQHWFRQRIVAWWYEAITWTNIDLSSVRSCGIHLRAILQGILEMSMSDMS